MSSNYEKVVCFNISFEVPVYNEPQKNIFKENKKLTLLRYKLIDEEVKELLEAIQTHDFVEVIDALCDILYVVYGAGASFGINLDNVFKTKFKYFNEMVHNDDNDTIYKQIFNF